MSLPHFGKLVHERFMEVHSVNKALSIAEFARSINIDRSTVYTLFEQRSPDVHKLMRISQVLNCNFLCVGCQQCDLAGTKKVTLSLEMDYEQFQELNLSKIFMRPQPIPAQVYHHIT